MADFYKNIDKLCSDGLLRRYDNPSAAVEGLTYTVVDDLTAEPVDIDDFKAHARIDFNTDDHLIEKYLKAARQYLEGWSQLSFGEKTIRVMALRLPPKWKLMYGPYTQIITPDTKFTLFGDTLMEGGSKIDITLETGWPSILPEVIKIAICRFAAGLYAVRENLIFSINGVPHEPNEIMDEAQKMLDPFRNITWP